MKSKYANWFIADCNAIIRATRRQIKYRWFEALNKRQKLNLLDTCHEVIGELERIKHNIKSHRYKKGKRL